MAAISRGLSPPQRTIPPDRIREHDCIPEGCQNPTALASLRDASTAPEQTGGCRCAQPPANCYDPCGITEPFRANETNTNAASLEDKAMSDELRDEYDFDY